MSSLTAAVVGLGPAGANRHVPRYASHPDVELLAVCDPDGSRASAVSTRHEVPHSYDYLAEALDAHEIDIVSVCTPVEYHLEHATKAIDGGAAVLIEKPMVASLSEADELRRSQREAEAKLSVVHNQKFQPGIAQGLEKCRQGELGDVKTIEFDLFVVGEDNRWINDPDNWCHSLPGGRWEECLPHHIYIPYNIVGDLDVVSVDCRKTVDRFPWLDFDEVLITLRSAEAYVTIRYSANSTKNMKDWVIRGTEGQIVFNYHRCEHLKSVNSPVVSGKSALKAIAQRNWLYKRLKWRLKNYADSGESAHDVQIDKFVGYVLGRTENPVPWEEAYATMRLVEAVSARIQEQSERTVVS